MSACPVSVGPIEGLFGPVEPEIEGPVVGFTFQVSEWVRGELDLEDHARAVVVPWNYTASCSPIRWGGGSWVEPGSERLLHVSLRSREYWAEGIPTFDAFTPEYNVFPHPSGIPRWFARESNAQLSLDQMVDLMRLVPQPESMEQSPREAISRALGWVRALGEDPLPYPAGVVGVDLAREAENAFARNSRPDVFGTYRVQVGLPSGAERSFYLRTAHRPSGAWFRPRPRSVMTPPLPWDIRGAGVDVYFWHAASEADLPIDSASASRDVRGEWPLRVTYPTYPGAPVHAGGLESGQLPRSIPGDQEVQNVLAAYQAEYGPRARAGPHHTRSCSVRKRSGGSGHMDHGP